MWKWGPMQMAILIGMGAYYFQTNPHCGSLIPLRKMNNRDIRRAFQVPVVEKTITLAPTGGNTGNTLNISPGEDHHPANLKYIEHHWDMAGIHSKNIANCLVVYLPLWKIWKSVGMIIPNIWIKNVPNHHPEHALKIHWTSGHQKWLDNHQYFDDFPERNLHGEDFSGPSGLGSPGGATAPSQPTSSGPGLSGRISNPVDLEATSPLLLVDKSWNLGFFKLRLLFTFHSAFPAHHDGFAKGNLMFSSGYTIQRISDMTHDF